MRSILILAMAVLLFSCSENNDTPDANDTTTTTKQTMPQVVTEAMATAYPQAANVEWEEEDGRYEGSFKENGMETTVIFNADGSVYATEKQIDVANLPEVVKTAAMAGGNVTEASIITLANGTMQYEVEVGDKDLTYNADGSLAGQEADEGDDDNDDE